MINKEKIEFNSKTYYTPSYSGVIGVKIIKLFANDSVLVECGKKKKRQFVRPLGYMYYEPEHARRDGRRWEHYEKNRKKHVKEMKKEDRKKNEDHVSDIESSM